MKYFIALLLITPHFILASHGKPQLVARFSGTDGWNAPANTWCFFSEPTILSGKIYLPCFDGEGNFMAVWDQDFKILARVRGERIFSNVVNSFGKASWYEYDQYEVKRSFEVGPVLNETHLENQSYSHFLPLGNDSWFYQMKGATPKLMTWEQGQVRLFFDPKAAFIFSPEVSASGEVALKTRETNLNESSPDKIWLYQNGNWKVVLEDRDANSTSRWKSFRHQLGVDAGRVVTIAQDEKGEALILIEKGITKLLARRGVDVKSFDYFSVKIRGSVIAFRGEDFNGRKGVYVHDESGLRRLISEGDIVQTDLGPGRIHYKNRDAIFYGAPAIGESGEILQQVTLTDPDFPRTFVGIALIKVQK